MISSATTADNILIRANMRSLYRDRYKCGKEIKSLKRRLDNPDIDKKQYNRIKEQIAIRSLQKGCAVVLNKKVDSIGNIDFYTCLCRLTHPLFNELRLVKSQFLNGIMPFSGGLLEQPAQIVELIQITDNAETQEESERKK